MFSSKTVKSSAAVFGFVAAILAGASAPAAIVDWSGTYRFEHLDFDRTSLGDVKGRKSYILNRLSLSPKIVAIDGVNIVSQFEVLSNSNYPGSQLGMPFGSGSARTSSATSNLYGKNQSSSSIDVRHLYLKVNQEYGSIVAGRAPIQFGLGMSYNAGYGMWDHWGDVHDMVGYRFMIDNVSIMPMMGRPYQQSLAAGSMATDVMWNIEYNNPDTKSIVGVFYQTRTADKLVNDGTNIFNATTAAKYAGASAGGTWGTQLVSIFLSRGWDGFDFKMEGGFNGGSTGIETTAKEDIRMNGYGLAVEMDFPRPEGKTEWSIKTGIASGDNPETANFEGFMFHRNYDVGMLMFNHPMGKYDIFTTNLQRSRAACTTPPCGFYSNDQAADEETLSNVFYIAPTLKYRIGERWTWKNTLLWAQVNQNSLAATLDPNTGDKVSDVKKDLGFEWDTGLVYQPHERVQWINELGLLSPGGAWKGGALNYENQFNYGFTSKAAISF